MLPIPAATGLPVVATRTTLLDMHHKFFKQQTARGDFIFVHETKGELVEIAVMPVDGLPLMRYSETSPTTQPLVDKEYPGWEPMRPDTHPEWRKLDEENWPKEMSALFIKLLNWYNGHGLTTQTYEQGRDAALAEEDRRLAEEGLLAMPTDKPAPPKRPTNGNGVPHTAPEQEHADP